jgi:hypothetical protein
MSEEKGSPSSEEEAEEEKGGSMSRERFLERVNSAMVMIYWMFSPCCQILHKSGAIQSP